MRASHGSWRLVLILAVTGVLAVTGASLAGDQPPEVGRAVRGTAGSGNPATTSSAGTTPTAGADALTTTVTTPDAVRPTGRQTTAAPVTAPMPPPVAGPGVAVGDSVLEDVQLYAPATLASRGFSFNASVSRQWAVGVSILSHLRAAGQLPRVVIVALGSNGRIDDGQFDQMMQACAGAKRVVFMTVTGPLTANNPVIIAGVGRYRSIATLADWAALAGRHPDWFGDDQVHVGPAGATALGGLLAAAA